MAYNEHLVERVRRILHPNDYVTERAMFGGIAFMVNGNMCCGVSGNNLVVRIGTNAATEALQEPHVSEMDFTGRTIKTMVYVGVKGLREDASLRDWIQRAIQYVETLPPKR